MAEVSTPIELFCSYAHKDEVWLRKLETHLSVLQRQGLISLWHNRLIAPGTDWSKTINTHLETASVILLLVSADFLASEYCYSVEMQRALARQEAGEARVVPILVRPVDWTDAPFAHLQVLPTDAKPIVSWPNKDTALADVAAGIRRAIVEELPQLSASAPRVALPKIWNVPYPRNPFFLGRDAELLHVRQNLQTGQATALSQPQAISGLGGIGKTQLALEYAYRYHREYMAILWARAESAEALISSYIALAALLRLPEREAKEQEIVIQAVKTWLQARGDWLLIFDNADELAILPDFLPPSLGGHLLLTTRATATGRLALRLEIETLQPEQGALFLLRRAALLAPDTELSQASQEERELAAQISEELGGLPLALDQAGAYMEETGMDLASYWQIYQQHRADLLQQRGGLVADHPTPVATTWSLSLRRVEEKNPAAADLLRICAYLSPDAIPEEIFTTGASLLGSVLAPVAADTFLLNQAIEALRAYSLVRRDPKQKLLSIHRLVQAVLQDELEEVAKQRWRERAVLSINAAFPESKYTTWPRCERLLSHALLAAQFIKTSQISSPEAVHLLLQTAHYLRERARYQEAELLYEQALRVREQALGPEHPDVASPLNSLAIIYREQGKYAQAEPLHQRALRVREQALGPEHPDVALLVSNLAKLYREQGKYAQAEPLYERALHIREQALGPEHPKVASPVNSLAVIYREQGKYAQAEPLQQQALYIREQALGPEHPDVAIFLINLANLYREQGKYAQAEPLYERALHIREQALGPEHPDVASPLNYLGLLYSEQRRYMQAEPLYQRALRIREQTLGPEHPDVAILLINLADLYHEQEKYMQAEPLYQRALRIRERTLGFEHLDTAAAMYTLALLQNTQGNKDEAKSLYARALAIRERTLGKHHPKTVETRESFITLLHAMGQHEEAAQLEAAQSEL